MAKQGIARIGISGWRYPPWRKTFYPGDLPQRRELEFASRALPTIELNGSFYSLQAPGSWQAWHDQTPDDFVFSVKAPKFITHVLRLREPCTAIANFFASGIANLGTKLGPILWQLPPNLKFDAALVGDFLAMLPRDTKAAAALARRHDAKVSGRCVLGYGSGVRPLRHAVEVRHESFVTPRFITMLRNEGVAFVVADTAGRWPEYLDVTSDFVYVRLHGASALYRSGYCDAQIDAWAARIDLWRDGSIANGPRIARPAAKARSGRDVFCYFDNTDKVHAPRNAQRLLAQLGIVRATIDAGGTAPAGRVAKTARKPRS
ncbi:MAG: DUF72 domain-containing protein [Casimicrobiaceae bacterium]